MKTPPPHLTLEQFKALPAVKRSEHDEQVALFRWVATRLAVYPGLDLLYAIPNGGQRTKAAAGKLKAEGVKAGVSDLHLPVPLHGKHGLWIEMKVKPNKPTEAQSAWLTRMQALGHAVGVAYSAAEAQELLVHYYAGVELPRLRSRAPGVLQIVK